MGDSRIAACRLCGFIDTGYLHGRDPAELTRQLIAGGVDIIQVRAKKEKQSKRLALAKAVVDAAGSVPVVVNDDIDAAVEAGAAGVHLGQEDWEALPRNERLARLIGLEILGLSTHSIEQALRAERDGANYIGVGPVFATGTKPQVPPVGLGLVRQVADRVHVPFFAIGGITPDNLDSVLVAGATRVAVVSAILTAPDVAAAARQFRSKL